MFQPGSPKPLKQTFDVQVSVSDVEVIEKAIIAAGTEKSPLLYALQRILAQTAK
jgi:hypothetical protein